MTDHHPTPRQALLDALVYAPAGLILTVVEELPELADKGRRRIEGRMTTARVVGQFAVQFARQQVAQRRDGGWLPGTPWARPGGSPTGTAAAAAGEGEPAPSGPLSGPLPAPEEAGPLPAPEEVGLAPVIEARARRAAPASRAAGGAPRRSPVGAGASTRRAPVRAASRAAGASRASATARPGRTGASAADEAAAGDGGSLGIPGYDSLSASQVVQRLAGLTPAELQEVRRHETAGRHRRTILNRVDQLLGGAARGVAPGHHPGPVAPAPGRATPDPGPPTTGMAPGLPSPAPEG